MGGTDGTNLRGLSVDTAGKLQAIANNSDLSSLISYDFTGAISSSTVLIPSTDVGTYAEASVQAVSLGTSIVVRFQYSNDNSTWVTAPIQTIADTSTTPITQFSSAGLYKIPLFGVKYFRGIASTGASAGTTTLRVYLNPRASTAISQAVNVANTLAVQLTPTASYGFTTYHTLISTATTNATNVKPSAAAITMIKLTNTSTAIRYFKIHNLTVAPTMGGGSPSTPILNYAIEPNSSQSIEFGVYPLRLATGFSYAITAGQALLDATAVGAGDVVVNVAYA
jgi:hypothetical protein